MENLLRLKFQKNWQIRYLYLLETYFEGRVGPDYFILDCDDRSNLTPFNGKIINLGGRNIKYTSLVYRGSELKGDQEVQEIYTALLSLGVIKMND